jgi:zinc transporter
MLGMNVGGIPFADSPYAFAVVTGGLVVLGVILAVWMRKRKWL